MNYTTPLSHSEGTISPALPAGGATASWLVRLGAVVGFAGLTALGAQIKVPLPNSPVPMTLQTLVVVISGVCLGSWKGSASQALYLFIGLAGVPVFAGGGAGVEYFGGATVGYLVGFLVAPAVAGCVTRRSSSQWRIATAVFVATATIFLCGLGWLLLSVTGGDLARALEFGLYPFLPGALIKGALALILAVLTRRAWSALG